MPRMALVSEGTKNQSQSLNAVWDCILPGEKKKKKNHSNSPPHSPGVMVQANSFFDITRDPKDLPADVKINIASENIQSRVYLYIGLFQNFTETLKSSWPRTVVTPLRASKLTCQERRQSKAQGLLFIGASLRGTSLPLGTVPDNLSFAKFLGFFPTLNQCVISNTSRLQGKTRTYRTRTHVFHLDQRADPAGNEV